MRSAAQQRGALRLEAEKSRLAEASAFVVEQRKARLALATGLRIERAKALHQAAAEEQRHRNALALAKYQARLADWANREKYKLDWELQNSAEMFRSVIGYGRASLRGVFLVNGAAAIATLSFLSASAHDMGATALKAALAGALVKFGWGVFLAVLGTGITYLTQVAYTEWTHSDNRTVRRVGYGLHALSIVAAIASVELLACGGNTVADALR